MERLKEPELEYDKKKTINYFLILKVLELLGLWFFIFGLYYIGLYVALKCPYVLNWFVKIKLVSLPINFIDFWYIGLYLFVFGTFLTLLIYRWVGANWNLAKKKHLTEESKKAKQEYEKKRDRLRWGYCVGDEAKYTCREKYATNKRRFGQKCIIGKIDSSGDIYPLWEDGSEGSVEGSEVGNGIGFIKYTSFTILKDNKKPNKTKKKKKLK